MIWRAHSSVGLLPPLTPIWVRKLVHQAELTFRYGRIVAAFALVKSTFDPAIQVKIFRAFVAVSSAER